MIVAAQRDIIVFVIAFACFMALAVAIMVVVAETSPRQALRTPEQTDSKPASQNREKVS